MSNAYDDKQLVVPYVPSHSRPVKVPKLRAVAVAYGDQRILAKRFAKWMYENCPTGFYNELKEAL